MSKAPSGRNRHKYVCLRASLQHHILYSVSAKHSFDTNIILYRKSYVFLFSNINDIVNDNTIESKINYTQERGRICTHLKAPCAIARRERTGN